MKSTSCATCADSSCSHASTLTFWFVPVYYQFPWTSPVGCSHLLCSCFGYLCSRPLNWLWTFDVGLWTLDLDERRFWIEDVELIESLWTILLRYLSKTCSMVDQCLCKQHLFRTLSLISILKYHRPDSYSLGTAILSPYPVCHFVCS